MGRPELSDVIMGTMKTWGGNYDSKVGCNHNGVADKVDQKIDSKSVTLNTEMDPNRAKPSNKNSGVDRGFVMGKCSPVMETTGHEKLTRSLKD